MQRFLFLISVLLFSTGFVLSQPFRYIRLNEYDRDSIKLLKISGYKEYVMPIGKPEEKYLASLATYDTNGNMTRKWIYDPRTGKQHQSTYKYSTDNLLLQTALYFPDSNTMTQQVIYGYDMQRNQVLCITESYSQGQLVRRQTVKQKYDEQNRCIEIKQFDQDGKQTSHYAYEYYEYGKKTELVYAPDGKLIHRREGLSANPQYHHPDGTPEDPDPIFANPEVVVTTKHNYIEGTYTIEDRYHLRKFNSNNMILYWLKKNSEEIWYEYSYYQ